MALSAFVFDAYGTLFDVHAAIARHRAAVGANADRVSDLWRSKQLEYTWTLTLAGQYRDFATLTEQALDYALKRFEIDRGIKPALLEAYAKLDAFADVRPALAALRAKGLPAAILSNGTPAMLQAAIQAAGLGELLDPILSVDAIRIYKPRREVYELAVRALHMPAADIGFVSSNRWDIAGAAAAGLKPIWLNRARAPEEYAELRPVDVVHDLSTLAELAI